MNSIRDTSSARHDSSEAVLVEAAGLHAIPKRSDTKLIVTAVGISAALILLFTFVGPAITIILVLGGRPDCVGDVLSPSGCDESPHCVFALSGEGASRNTP